jgi:hypothetical protein
MSDGTTESESDRIDAQLTELREHLEVANEITTELAEANTEAKWLQKGTLEALTRLATHWLDREGEYFDAKSSADPATGDPVSLPQDGPKDLWLTVRTQATTIAKLTAINETLVQQLSERTRTPDHQLRAKEPPTAAPRMYNAVTRSSNPTPISPPHRLPPKKPAPPTKPTSPTQRHHQSRLVLHYAPPLELGDEPEGTIVARVNNALDNPGHQIPEHIRVKGVTYSRRNRSPILVAADSCTAEDLEKYSPLITAAVAGGRPYNQETAKAKADRQRFEVCINNAPTKWYHGAPMEPEHIETAIQSQLRLENPPTMAAPPRFLIAQEKREYMARGTILVSFHEEDIANRLLSSSTIFIDGSACSIRAYSDRNPIVYCQACSSLRHREFSRSCPGQRCDQCASDKHSSLQHPPDSARSCINCKGNHESRAKECPARRQKASMPSEPAKPKIRKSQKKASTQAPEPENEPEPSTPRRRPPHLQKTQPQQPLNTEIDMDWGSTPAEMTDWSDEPLRNAQ